MNRCNYNTKRKYSVQRQLLAYSSHIAFLIRECVIWNLSAAQFDRAKETNLRPSPKTAIPPEEAENVMNNSAIKINAGDKIGKECTEYLETIVEESSVTLEMKKKPEKPGRGHSRRWLKQFQCNHQPQQIAPPLPLSCTSRSLYIQLAYHSPLSPKPSNIWNAALHQTTANLTIRPTCFQTIRVLIGSPLGSTMGEL